MRFPVGASVTAEELAADPHPVLARLRRSEPVSWLPALGGWLVTRHDLAVRVLRDAAVFTVDDPRFSTARVIGPSMLSLDGPVHARHRDPFARPFRPAPVRERFTGFVAQEVDRLVAAVRARGHAEIRSEIAGPLAVGVIARALGLDGVDASTVRSWYDAFVRAISAITAGRGEEFSTEPRSPSATANDRWTIDVGSPPGRAGDFSAAQAQEELRATVASALAAESSPLLGEAARELSTSEVVANAAVLMFGGIDTTEGMISNAVLHLLRDAEQLSLVRGDPGLLPAAVEESLRLEPSASVVDRYATADARLAGVAIRKGDLVRVSLAAANRDPAMFADPDRYDLRRGDADRHLAFARGPHFCFGAHLARLETITALTALLHLPDLRLAEGAEPSGLVFRKPAAVHVRWAFTL